MLTIKNNASVPFVVYDIVLHADVSILDGSMAHITDDLWEKIRIMDLT
jgi:hypothetical protein